ncbi:MAG: cytochrome c biogenesis protein ResB [Verrucomicrobiota bacterium]|nr:cytochrome c biogenesis protein ResB [Verrucomicrobiota bacterium]
MTQRQSAGKLAGGSRRLWLALWRFFTSIRVALWLIGLTAGWVLLATLAQSTVPAKIANAAPRLAGVMLWWNSWAVWHSPFFLTTLALLAVSTILGGMVDRWPGIAQRIWRPNVHTSAGFFLTATKADQIVAPCPAPAAAAAVTATFAQKRYRILLDENGPDGDVHFYADKHRFSPLATFPFHSGLVLLLIGAMILSAFGWREVGFLVPDGSTRAVGHGTGLTIKNDQFVDNYYESGIPRDYYSDLEIYQNGKAVASGRVRVNAPINLDGVSIHQAAYGQAAKIRIEDATTGQVLFEDGVPLFVAENKAISRGFVDEAGDYRPIGQQPLNDLGISLLLVGTGGPGDQTIGVSQVAFAFYDNKSNLRLTEGLLNIGDSQTVGNIKLSYLRELRFTGLQITHAPGLWLIYLSAGIIFASMLVSFYRPHRRMRALIVARPGGGALVRLGAQVRLDPVGAREFAEIARIVKERLAFAPDSHEPAAQPARLGSPTPFPGA